MIARGSSLSLSFPSWRSPLSSLDSSNMHSSTTYIPKHCPSLHPLFLSDLVLDADACILKGLRGNKETLRGGGEWICVRWSPNNAGDSQASAGLQCWPGFKSLLLANWDREGASCDWAADGFKGAAGAGLPCPGDLLPLGPLEQSIRADGAPEHQPLTCTNCAEPSHWLLLLLPSVAQEFST